MSPIIQEDTAAAIALVQKQDLFHLPLHTSATTGDSGPRYYRDIFLYIVSFRTTIDLEASHPESFSRSGGTQLEMVHLYTPER